MNVRKNARFLMMLVSLYSVPVAMLSSWQHRFEKSNVTNNSNYFMNVQAQAMTGHEFINLNARKWLGTKTNHLQHEIDAIDRNCLMHDNVQTLNRKTDELYACMKEAAIDPKLFRSINNSNGVKQTRNNHSHEHGENFFMKAFCCGTWYAETNEQLRSVHGSDEEKEKARRSYVAAYNLAVNIVHQRMDE